MSKISTKDLIEEFFSTPMPEATLALRRLIDKPELYEYESNIGKQLIDMNPDEIYNLIVVLLDTYNKNRTRYTITHNSYYSIVSLLRALFDYYINNAKYEVIRNPILDKSLRGREAMQRLAQSQRVETLTFETVQKIINKIHADKDTDRADYTELIILAFYCGFANAEEIANIKKKDVNHVYRTVNVPGRVVHLNHRCYELFEKFSNMDMIDGWHGKYCLVSWNDSYFKFIVRPKKSLDFNERSLPEVRDIINRQFSAFVKSVYDINLNGSVLFYLGFYDHLVKKFGEKYANYMITSYRERDTDCSNKFLSNARDYGIDVSNVSYLKRCLSQFVRTDE